MLFQKTISILILFSFTFILSAQETLTNDNQSFESAIGLRLGQPLSISYKRFLNETNALEAYVGYRSFSGLVNFLSLNAAYQVHRPLDNVDGLSWYGGGGASIYFWGGDFIESQTSFGLSGYLGLSYKLKETPFNITADWVPTLIFSGDLDIGTGFDGGYGAIAVRYILN